MSEVREPIPQRCIDEAAKGTLEHRRLAEARRAPLATKQGKKAALAAFHDRKRERAGIKPVNNSLLYAGEPMYYYCQHCGDIADIKDECHTDVVERSCRQCQALKDKGWLP